VTDPADRFPIFENKPSTVDASPALDSNTRPGANATNNVTDVTGVTGVTGADWLEVWPAPTPFVAVTVNVYGVPFVNPVTVHVTAPVVVHVLLSGDDVTV